MKWRRSVFWRAGKGMAKMIMSNASPGALSFSGRQSLIDSSQAAALADPLFRDLIIRADAARDNRDWKRAADNYGEALRLFPFERSYWTQLGHAVKEQGVFADAEVYYRTALAYGAPELDVLPHARFVLAQQCVSEDRFPFRIQDGNAAARQVPGGPDVTAYSRLLWGALSVDVPDTLALLRISSTCDDLVAAMVRDPRFERANRVWLELVREDEL